MKNNNFLKQSSQNKNHSQNQSQVKRSSSLSEVCESVKCQIEADCFYKADEPLVNEIALIIAEVYCLPDNLQIRIAGNDLPVCLVSDVYRRLTGEHVETVIDNFRRADYEIKYKKTYLRTALYNSVFEAAAKAENTVRSFLG